MGVANNNPILDTREYVVEFMDGHEETMTANLIAEHLFSQIDDDGNRQVLLDEIIDHRVDIKTAVQEKDAYIKIKSGQKIRKKTTKGWEFLVKWKDGSTNWISLKDMKESFTYRSGTCICMVGTTCYEKEGNNYIQSKIGILVDNT